MIHLSTCLQIWSRWKWTQVGSISGLETCVYLRQCLVRAQGLLHLCYLGRCISQGLLVFLINSALNFISDCSRFKEKRGLLLQTVTENRTMKIFSNLNPTFYLPFYLQKWIFYYLISVYMKVYFVVDIVVIVVIIKPFLIHCSVFLMNISWYSLKLWVSCFCCPPYFRRRL